MMLTAGPNRAIVDLEHGGRIASLRVGDLELLVAEGDVDDPKLWGCYPMVPWAGRVRDGRFRFRGAWYDLPIDAPPHAIHGVGYDAAWTATSDGGLRLGLDWPLGGAAEQRVELTESALSLTMAVTAGDRPMPVVAGWHPCFRRRLDRGDEAKIAIDPATMWERDDAGIPTGRQVPVPDGPWDDCFAGLAADPRITWPGALEVAVRSTCPAWVVYDEDPRLVCVEPQTDAPDAFNRDPTVLEPGQRLELGLAIEWSAHV